MTTESVTYVGPYPEVELALPDSALDLAVEHGETIEVDLAVAKNLVAQETWEYAGDGPPADVPAPTKATEEFAGEVGVDLDGVEGSGKDGRITKADVEAAAAEQTASSDQTNPPEPGATTED